MSTFGAKHVDCLPTQLAPLLLSAALRLLQECGEDSPSVEFRTRYLRDLGFIVTQYRGRDGIDRLHRLPGTSSVSEGIEADGDGFLVDISAGETLATIRWRDDETVGFEHLIRGPWEFDFLAAAGVVGLQAPGSTASAGFTPASTDSWVLQGGPSSLIAEWKLSQPLLFAVLGDHSSVTMLVDEDEGLASLTDHVRNTYCEARSQSALSVLRGVYSTAHFSVWAWANPSRFTFGWPTQRPLLRYCVSRGTKYEDVGYLLLGFDRSVHHAEMAMAEALEQLRDQHSTDFGSI